MQTDERISITPSEFIELRGHMVPRNRRVRCARCERWMTVDQSVARQYCPHCGEVVVLERF